MEQDDKVYVIRHLSFWYTDEWYRATIDMNAHVGHITDLFDNKEDAIQRWKQLEYEFSHQVDFQNIIYSEYSHDEFYHQESILAQKSVDELFEIIQKLECHVYGLYAYPKQLKQHVLFDRKSQQYDICELNTEYDIKSNNFILANFDKSNPLIEQISPPITNSYENYITLHGSLEELSDTPLLLQHLIQQLPDIEYIDQKSLKVKFKDLAQVNALLKEPVEQEIHDLSIEEIYQLEKKFN